MQVQTETRPPMSQQPFTAFIHLISLDQDIRTIQNKITALNADTDQFLHQKNEFMDRIAKFKQHVHELKKVVHAHELTINELDAEEKKKKKLLDQVQDNREYTLLKKEIERLKQSQHETEAELMGAYNKLEIAQKELSEQETSYDAKIAELHEKIATQQENRNQLQTELESKTKERPEKEAYVPQEWLEKYTHMRSRVNDPVVPVMRGGCSACFYTVPDHEMMRLRRKALVQCKGCFRLLFLEEAMQEEQKEKTNP